MINELIMKQRRKEYQKMNSEIAGKYIKACRTSLGMSMREFGKKYNIGRETLCLLEHGRIKKPSMNTLSSLSKALNKPLTDVYAMYNIEEISKGEIDTKVLLSEVLVKYGVNPEDIKYIVPFIDFIKHQRENNIDYNISEV